MNVNYQICTRCVMDNASDNSITFNDKGICNYCTSAFERMKFEYFPNDEGEVKLRKLVSKLKKDGENKKYDCLMGVSGGLDSSYLLYLGTKWGLRILAIHIDDGFNSDISEANIKKLVAAANVDYVVIKPDRVQYNALIKAYIKAGVPNLAIPQDNILLAYLYKYARKYKINNFLSGGNFALESILQRGNSYRSLDVINIKAIHKRFGTESIKKLPFISDYLKFVYEKVFKIKTYRPLDFINYNRNNALEELRCFCEFDYYGTKHLENTLTKFIQVYWFYNKFGVDKRRSHLSSMIVSGQLTREIALLKLQSPIYDENEISNEIHEICNKLNISIQDFKSIMKEQPKQHMDYPIDNLYILVKKFFFN